MIWRRLNRLAAAFGIGALILSACATEADSPSSGASRDSRPNRPNIIFVMADDLSSDLVVHMPQVRRMQRTGATFSNYFVTNSLCCPSRASIFTGRFPHNTGVVTNYPPDGGYQEFLQRGEERNTYATALRAAGYRTGLMGKYFNGYDPVSAAPNLGPRVPPGWDEWYVAGDGYSGFNYTLSENGRAVRYGNAPRDYLTDVLAAKGMQFIKNAKASRKPFLLQLSVFTPHGPIVPAPRHANAVPELRAPRPPSFNEADVSDKPRWLKSRPPLTAKAIRTIDEKFRNRVRTMLSVDEMIAQLQRQLAALGLDRDTYLVFSSDNGFHLGQHRLASGKMTAYDTDIRVPFIVTGPGVPAGLSVDALAQNTDVFPTFLELAGLRAPARIDGRSLVPWMRGRQAAGWRTAVLVEQRKHENVPYDPDLQGPADGNPPTYWALRQRDSLYVEYATGEREFYDTVRDPYQLRNLIGGLGPARSSGLAATLRALKNCSGPTCRSADRTK